MLPPVDARTIAGSQHERGVDELDDEQMDDVLADRPIPVVVAPDKGSRDTPKRWPTAGGRRGCEQCSDPTTGASDTESEDRPWSRSTVTPNTTRASSAFTDETG
jgi:hypothetical protein